MKKTILPLLLLAAAACPVQAQKTQILTADKSNDYGLVYSLPKTAVTVIVTATHTQGVPGEFFRYANRYIGSASVVSEPYSTWSIDNVTVGAVGIPDPEQQYLMQVKSGAPTYLCVSEDGMILAINTRVDDPIQGVRPAMAPARTAPVFTGEEYLQYVTDDFLSSRSSAKKAQMLAESLMEVRDAKLSLTRGTADSMPSDGKQLELMLSSLSDQEAAMTRAFAGVVTIEQVTRTFTFCPDGSGRQVLFRLSKTEGFLDADNLAGEPVYISVENVRRGELPKDGNGDEKKFPKDGVAYAIPGSASVTVSSDGAPLWQGDMEIAQFGTVFALSPSVFVDKKAPQCATFNPATGALVQLAPAQ